MLNLLKYVWAHPLNSGAKLAATWRVIRWQIASRLVVGPIAMPYVAGTWLFATRGMTGATGNWYCGLHEVNEMAFVLHLLRPGEHLVDVGANIGSYTILAAGGAKAQVTAFEPIPSTFSHLQRNVLLNGLSEQVQCFQAGLSDAPGSLRFSSGLDTVNHVLALGEDLASVDVPVLCLDDVVKQNAPTLMKIDVEGHELSVLRGGSKTLADKRLLAVIMETNGSGARYGVGDEQLLKVMHEHGFAPYGYDPFKRQLIDVSASNGNTVFVRGKAEVESRVKSAQRFKLVNGDI
jgi:FkbM family methyltransferase